MDSGLRRSQREAAQGDLADEGRLLLQRLRAGELSANGLKLAAYLGHSAAQAALSLDPTPRETDTVDWLRGFLALADEPAIGRAASACLRCCLPVSMRHQLADAPHVRAFLSLEGWILEPSAENAERAAAASMELEGGNPNDSRCWVQARLGVRSAARVAGGQAEAEFKTTFAHTLLALDAEGAQGRTRAFVPGPAAVRAAVDAIAEELLPWLLGLKDPVLERSELR